LTLGFFNTEGITQTEGIEDGMLRRRIGAEKEDLTKRLQKTA
jgi:hypothetical protein